MPLVCLGAAGLTAVLLFLTLRLDRADLCVPLHYGSDANIFIARAKAVAEGNWVWHNPRLGAPWGADLRDFPMNITLDSAGMWVLSRFTKSPGLIVNLEWLLAIAATAALAAWAFLRLGLGGALALMGGAVFALLPYVYFRGISHLHSLYYAVPPVCVAAIELARGKLAGGERGMLASVRRIPAYAWIACAIAGLSYSYTAFFACFVLLCGGGIALLGRRDMRSAALAVVLVAATAAVVAADLSPSLVYWARQGRNASMLFKSPAEAQLYGLKIRYLLTPVPGHVIPAVRAAEARLAEAKYPLSKNESEGGRLGLIGSLGFLVLIAVAAGALVNPGYAGAGEGLLGPAAAITLGCILLGASGGFGDFFNVAVSPDIRCYARIFPFIGFFCVMAAMIAARRLERRLRPRLRVPAAVAIALLAAYDQALPASRMHEGREAAYRSHAAFVRRVETVLPPGSAVFELPFTDFPNEILPAKLGTNDLLMPYLHSSKYRWSWGGVSGTTPAEWGRQTAGLPVPAMLDAVAHRGFSGLWVDLAGFEAGRSPEEAVTRETGAAPMRDPSGRFLFYDLRGCAAARLARESTLPAGELLARHPVQVLFERGFYYEERDGSRIWRWSLRRGRMTLVNPLAQRRRIILEMQAAAPAPCGLIVSRPGRIDRLRLPASYRSELEIPASGTVSLDLVSDCRGFRPAGSPRVLWFYVSGVTARDE